MNQKIPWAAFAGGGMGFFAMATEMLAGHNDWAYFYSTPLGFLHGLFLGITFAVMVLGALGVQLPRSNGGCDRSTDRPPTTTKPGPPSPPKNTPVKKGVG